MRSTLQNDVFWAKCEGLVKLFKPLELAIAEAEGDTATLSIAVKVFAELEKSFSEGLGKSPVLKSEEKKILECIKKRREFLITPVHLAANMLDPRFMGCHVLPSETVSVIFMQNITFDTDVFRTYIGV